MLSSFIDMTYHASPDRALEVAEQRWRETLDRRPDLEPAIELQRRLVTRSQELAVIIDQKLPVTLDLSPAPVAAKLRRHTPVLVGEAIVVDARALVPFVLGFCEDLSSGAAGGAAGRLGETLDRGKIDIRSLLAASLGRQQAAIHSKAHHVGVAPDVLWLVAELASGPVAHRLQQQILTDLPEQDDELRSVIGEWDHGFCAACGSWPAFGERIDKSDATVAPVLLLRLCMGTRGAYTASIVTRLASRSSLPPLSLSNHRDASSSAGSAAGISSASTSGDRRRSRCSRSKTSQPAIWISARSNRDMSAPPCTPFRRVTICPVPLLPWPRSLDHRNDHIIRSRVETMMRHCEPRPPGRASAAAVAAVTLLVAVSSWSERAAAQDRVPHGRLFPPEDLGLLEGPDRDAWQQPEQVMDALGIADGARVADLGAGGGWFTVRLSRRVGPNGRVYAEDIQPQMIESIARRVSREGLANVMTVLGTPNDPRLPTDLDAVLIVSTYPEMTDPVALLENVAASLKPNGRVGIIDFRLEGGGPGPPADERVEPDAVIRDAERAGLQLLARKEFLTYQYLLVFGQSGSDHPAL